MLHPEPSIVMPSSPYDFHPPMKLASIPDAQEEEEDDEKHQMLTSYSNDQSTHNTTSTQTTTTTANASPNPNPMYLWSPSSSSSISSQSSAPSSSRSSPSPPTPTSHSSVAALPLSSSSTVVALAPDALAGVAGSSRNGLVFPPVPPTYRAVHPSPITYQPHDKTDAPTAAVRRLSDSGIKPQPQPQSLKSTPRQRHPSPPPPTNRTPTNRIKLRSSAAFIPPLRTPYFSSGWNSPGMWIVGYFFFNMGLTLYNKAVLVHFPYPYTMTALHTFCGTIGCMWARRVGYYSPAHLTPRQKFTLALFSILYTFNIALSNLSLQLVTVPFHQVVRASAPFFTILVSWLLRSSNRHHREDGWLGVGKMKLVSLLPVIAGVGFATYGDYSFTAWGLILTLFGTFLAALKTVLTSILQTAPAASKLETPLPTATHFPFNSPYNNAGGGIESRTPEIPWRPRTESNASLVSLGSPHFQSFAIPSAEKERGRVPYSPLIPPSPSPLARSTFEKQGGMPKEEEEEPAVGLVGKTLAFIRFLNPLRIIASPSTGLGFITKRFDLDFGDSLNRRGSSTNASSNGEAVVQQMSMIKLHPLDLLSRMSPLACVQCILYAFLSGEFARLRASPTALAGGWAGGGSGSGFGSVLGEMIGRKGMVCLVLGMNGIIAFGLNVVSLTANQKNGPLTMTVAANVKQVLTVLLAMSVFHLTIGPTNALGIALTLFGGAWYGALEFRSKRERMRLG